MMLRSCVWLILIANCFCLNAKDKKSNSVRENIQEVLKIEIQVSKEDAQWQKEKQELLLEKKLLELQVSELKKRNEKRKELVKHQKEKLESEKKIHQSLTKKHELIFLEMQQSVVQLDEIQKETPEAKAIHSMIGTLRQSVKGQHDEKDITFLFDQINDFHDQLWQMGQSYSIKESTVKIDDKAYHGDLVRMGLVYQFLIFKDRSRWAYLHSVSKKWQFGKKEELKKVITIYNILEKKEPSKLVELPEMGGAKK